MSGSAFLYIVCDDYGFCKIGVAQNVEKRLRELQIGNASSLTLAWSHASDTPYAHEASAHNAMRAKHIRGEWFECSPEDAVSAVFEAMGGERIEPPAKAPLADDTHRFFKFMKARGYYVVAEELGAEIKEVVRWSDRGIPKRFWHSIMTTYPEMGLSDLILIASRSAS